jgi:flagellar basal body-associated protein FliL
VAAEGEKKKPNKLVVIIIILTAVILLGIVAVIFMATGIKLSDVTDRFVKHEEYIVQMDSFVVNLNSEGRTTNYLKTQVSLMYTDKKKGSLLEEKTSQIRDVVITDLMGYSPNQLLAQDGLEKVKAQLKKQINQALEEEVVEEVYFTDFLIQ